MLAGEWRARRAEGHGPPVGFARPVASVSGGGDEEFCPYLGRGEQGSLPRRPGESRVGEGRRRAANRVRGVHRAAVHPRYVFISRASASASAVRASALGNVTVRRGRPSSPVSTHSISFSLSAVVAAGFGSTADGTIWPRKLNAAARGWPPASATRSFRTARSARTAASTFARTSTLTSAGATSLAPSRISRRRLRASVQLWSSTSVMSLSGSRTALASSCFAPSVASRPSSMVRSVMSR